MEIYSFNRELDSLLHCICTISPRNRSCFIPVSFLTQRHKVTGSYIQRQSPLKCLFVLFVLPVCQCSVSVWRASRSHHYYRILRHLSHVQPLTTLLLEEKYFNWPVGTSFSRQHNLKHSLRAAAGVQVKHPAAVCCTVPESYMYTTPIESLTFQIDIQLKQWYCGILLPDKYSRVWNGKIDQSHSFS